MSCGREISSLESVYFSGSPFFADINLALLYPMNALYFILPPFQALTVGALLDILWDSWACIFCAEVCVFNNCINIGSSGVWIFRHNGHLHK